MTGRLTTRFIMVAAALGLALTMSGCATEEQKRAEEAEKVAAQLEILQTFADMEKTSCEERGYDFYSSGVCFRWLESNDPRRDCGYSRGKCSVMEVSPTYGCQTLYVEANFVDSSGTIVDYSNDVVKGVGAEGSALVKFVSFDKSAESVQPTKFSCY